MNIRANKRNEELAAEVTQLRRELEAEQRAREEERKARQRAVLERDEAREELAEAEEQATLYVVERADGRTEHFASVGPAVTAARNLAWRSGIETRVRHGEALVWSTAQNGSVGVWRDGVTTTRSPRLTTRF